MNLAEMYNAVQSRYSNVATGTENDVYASRVAASFGYTKDDLDNIPKGANLGVSCGNPLAVAGLREASAFPLLKKLKSNTASGRSCR